MSRSANGWRTALRPARYGLLVARTRTPRAPARSRRRTAAVGAARIHRSASWNAAVSGVVGRCAVPVGHPDQVLDGADVRRATGQAVAARSTAYAALSASFAPGTARGRRTPRRGTTPPAGRGRPAGRRSRRRPRGPPAPRTSPPGGSCRGSGGPGSLHRASSSAPVRATASCVRLGGQGADVEGPPRRSGQARRTVCHRAARRAAAAAAQRRRAAPAGPRACRTVSSETARVRMT